MSDYPGRAGPCARRVSAMPRRSRPHMGRHVPRSEEHTSELQSRLHLVCRLLRVKKKTYRSSSFPRGMRNLPVVAVVATVPFPSVLGVDEACGRSLASPSDLVRPRPSAVGARWTY